MMKQNSRSLRRFVVSVAFLSFAMQALAYPPAPPHEIYGLVRGTDGGPLSSSSAKLIFKTDEGVQIKGSVSSIVNQGVNYQLTIPMDAAISPDPYIPEALTPLAPFRISVLIGGVTNLPIEMNGDYKLLGQYGESTRIDLTLGVDSDGDGLPDVWEEILISMLGGTNTLEEIRPEDDSDQDGMSNMDEYLAGTYAFDANDVFKLYVKEIAEDRTVFNFLGIKDRSYQIQQSSDLRTWKSCSFTVPAEGVEERTFFNATVSSVLEVEVVSTNAVRFFRGFVH
jgi:hypothetical protein